MTLIPHGPALSVHPMSRQPFGLSVHRHVHHPVCPYVASSMDLLVRHISTVELFVTPLLPNFTLIEYKRFNLQRDCMLIINRLIGWLID